jgi:hypothetical protein
VTGVTKRTYQLYASITASVDNAASIMLPTGGRLKRVLWNLTPTGGPATGDYTNCELSVNSARQTTTNEATGILSVASIGFVVLTSGSLSPVTVETNPDVALKTGDKVYLHATENGTQTVLVRVILYLE